MTHLVTKPVSAQSGTTLSGRWNLMGDSLLDGQQQPITQKEAGIQKSLRSMKTKDYILGCVIKLPKCFFAASLFAIRAF